MHVIAVSVEYKFMRDTMYQILTHTDLQICHNEIEKKHPM